MLGIPLILIHNIWDGSWRVIITIIVWLVLLKGIARVFFPERAVGKVRSLVENTVIVKALIWAMIIIGFYLLYIGFDFGSVR